MKISVFDSIVLLSQTFQNRKSQKQIPLGDTLSDFCQSKSLRIRPFKPINRGWRAHVHGVEFNSTPGTCACQRQLIGLNGRIGRLFD